MPAAPTGLSAARFRFPVAPTEGFCDATTTTTPAYVDLYPYIGKEIFIYAESDDHYICFGDSATLTLQTGAAAIETPGVVMTIHSEHGSAPPPIFSFVVPRSHHFLHYRAVATTGILRVIV